MTKAYYNEFEPFAAQWLRNLIEAGLIAPGDVDERSIVDVKPNELTGYTQCHFFEALERLRMSNPIRAAMLARAPQRRIASTGRQFARVKGARSASLKSRANRRKAAR